MAIENISVIKLRDLLLVTVPPDPDDQTVSALQEQVLEAMAQHECQGPGAGHLDGRRPSTRSSPAPLPKPCRWCR